ncbi:hypothetical protein A2Y85_01000 [candidate division WOR-3 bacterium RBG_13_43_14]|uniref:Uncharacterized protein n=1 Tax=candidate division WOR-3 bacterium RBG_13_43_14 TaxID=1802590 RepID=A0A1F4UBC7_UNCW3|nr:MAG: hypothetical protein A2Y85_01000 [candidate division WOR-3 bacterium RBG_13_43_14]
MRKRIILLALFVTIFIIAAIFILSPKEKKRIKQDITSLKTAVAHKDINEALQYISRDYNDGHHNNFESFSYSIQQLIDNFDSINIIMTGMKISIDSVNSAKTVFAACSMGLKIFARYEREKTLVFGGIVKPASVKMYLKKINSNYQIYHAQY